MPNLGQQQEDKFDLVTHITDSATQKTKAVNLYRLHIINGIRYFERPVNSGNLWFENNKPAGRISYAVNAKGDTEVRIDGRAEHVAYTPPPTGAEKIAAELAEAKTAAAAAQAELAAIKAERAAKAEPQAQKKDEKK